MRTKKREPTERLEVESTDYAQREYGVTPQEVAAFADVTEKRYRRLKKSKKLVTVTPEQLRKLRSRKYR